jgi:hypothetical protein
METRVSDVTTAALAPHEHAGRGDELPDRPTVSVIICAYTEDRWLQLANVSRRGSWSPCT